MMFPRLLLSSLFTLIISSSAMSTPSPTTEKVAVIGSTGRLGRQAVIKLSESSIPCKILVRKDPATAVPSELTPELESSQVAAYLGSLNGVEIVKGDVTSTDSLKELLSDCTSCLSLYGATRRSKISDLWKDPSDTDSSHPKQVNWKGVQNIIDAAKASKSCKRIVRITGKGETPDSFFSVLINMLGSMAKAWNYEGERLLRAEKDIDYTIVRPGLMGDDGPTGSVLALADNGADLPVAKIRYTDVAQLCIDCLGYPNAARTTLTAMTTAEGGSATFGPLLETVKEDSREYPADMFSRHQGAVRKVVTALLGGGALVLAVFVQILVKIFTR